MLTNVSSRTLVPGPGRGVVDDAATARRRIRASGRVRVMGRATENDAVVTGIDPPRRAALRGPSRIAPFEATLAFEPADLGTRVEVETTFVTSAGRCGRSDRSSSAPYGGSGTVDLQPQTDDGVRRALRPATNGPRSEPRPSSSVARRSGRHRLRDLVRAWSGPFSQGPRSESRPLRSASSTPEDQVERHGQPTAPERGVHSALGVWCSEAGHRYQTGFHGAPEQQPVVDRARPVGFRDEPGGRHAVARAGRPGRALAVGLVLAATVSPQVGAACRRDPVDELGPAGAAFLRLAFAAVVLWAIWRPRLTGDLRLAGAFGVGSG